MKIKELRLKKGWSMQRLADESDLHLMTIVNAEKGHSNTIRTKRKLAKALNVKVEDLED